MDVELLNESEADEASADSQSSHAQLVKIALQ
jgi:hypothetical protein